ncbi:multiheme c-type cytochrome [Hydrogenimonas sp.]
MFYFFSLILISASLFGSSAFAPSKLCKKCHPLIYKEYSQSMHKKSSIYNDPVHKAIWLKHPLRKKSEYVCAVCHTPSDTSLIKALKEKKPALPKPNEIQMNEPIGCATCHRIESIERHTKQNSNVYSQKRKYYYAAKNGKRVDKVLKFQSKSSFFGLTHDIEGSPFHTIDYSNGGFSDGKICLGCHDHKRNEKKLAICSMDIKKSDKDRNNCITCHMPQVQGSFTTIVKSRTHAYHGFAGLHTNPGLLSKSIDLKAKSGDKGLSITIENGADHKLFAHPLRLAQLRVQIDRNGETIKLEPVNFFTILGKGGKPAMPWSADSILKQNVIKAHEKRRIDIAFTPRKGDEVHVTLGYYIVNPKAAKKLGITRKDLMTFRTLVSRSFLF